MAPSVKNSLEDNLHDPALNSTVLGVS